MLRWILNCLVAMSLAFAGPSIAHAKIGAGSDPGELCALHGGADTHEGHGDGHHGDGHHGNADKSLGKACCQANCPAQSFAAPNGTILRVAPIGVVEPIVAATLTGQSAAPDTPPPRL